MRNLWITSVIMCLFQTAGADSPSWAKTDTQKLEGSTLKVICCGTGPSLDSARQDALESCRNSARQQLISNIKVKTLTIQTEQSAGFHEEILENTQYSGLKCVPERDQVEEGTDFVKVWMQCRFNLKQVKSMSTGESEVTDIPSTEYSDTVKNRATLNNVGVNNRSVTAGRFISSKSTTFSIASVPACESLVIRGDAPRKIDCDQNPMTITLFEKDVEIIVRTSGYQPKTVQVGTQRRSHDSVQIILDPL